MLRSACGAALMSLAALKSARAPSKSSAFSFFSPSAYRFFAVARSAGETAAAAGAFAGSFCAHTRVGERAAIATKTPTEIRCPIGWLIENAPPGELSEQNTWARAQGLQA